MENYKRMDVIEISKGNTIVVTPANMEDIPQHSTLNNTNANWSLMESI